jgi:hypothetical protein
VGVRTPERYGEAPPRAPAIEPPWVATFGVALAALALLLINGRPIPAGDTRVNDRVAASLVTEGDFDLDEYADVEAPFVRDIGGHKVSIYPTLSAVLAAPVFAAVRLVFALDETGLALAGKLAASLFSAMAAAVLFVAVGRRRGEKDGIATALVFAIGTSVWSTSQDLWQHPAAVLAIAVALLFLSRALDDPVWAGRVGLPLGIAFAARHADVALVATLAVVAIVRWPKHLPALALWSLPPLLFVAAYNLLHFGAPWQQGFGDAGARFDAPWGVGHAGLLISPAKGLLIFTPVVIVGLVGLVRAWGSSERPVAVAALAAAAAHWLFVGRWGEWHGGESWGPRMMTDALPALLLFLPEGLDLTRAAGALLALFSCAVQALGAFSYDLRWERLYQRPNAQKADVLWSIEDSPILFHVRERVVILAVPGLDGDKAIVRRHPVVVAGPIGSRLRFSGDELRVEGSPETFGDAHLQNAAHVSGDAAVLRGHWAGIFLRVGDDARAARLTLTVEGKGSGTLYVGERSFWVPSTRWATYPISGPFRVAHPYFYPSSGGRDIVVTVGRGGGEAEIRSLALVPPSSR